MDWTPGSLLEMSGYYWKTCTLHAGVSLDIFTLLGTDALSGETMAEKTGMDQRGLVLLLNGLTALGLLVNNKGTYANTPESSAFLSKKFPWVYRTYDPSPPPSGSLLGGYGQGHHKRRSHPPAILCFR